MLTGGGSSSLVASDALAADSSNQAAYSLCRHVRHPCSGEEGQRAMAEAEVVMAQAAANANSTPTSEAAAQQEAAAAAPSGKGKGKGGAAAAAAPAAGPALLSEVLSALADDLNTPAAVGALSAPLRTINDLLTTKAGRKRPDRLAVLAQLHCAMCRVMQLLGMELELEAGARAEAAGASVGVAAGAASGLAASAAALEQLLQVVWRPLSAMQSKGLVWIP